MDQPNGSWIYCVVENKGNLEWDCRGIGDSGRVRAIAFGDYAVVVSDEPLKKYPLKRDFLIAHQVVNETVMKTHDILPVRFCTMAPDEDTIVDQILRNKKKTEEFRKAFAEIRDCDEYGLRARWENLELALTEVAGKNKHLRAAKERALLLTARDRHTALVQVGEIVKRALDEENAATANVMIRSLAPLAMSFKQNRTSGDMNILNAAFLVHRNGRRGFDEAVSNLIVKHGSQIQFKYIGPTPPFNFVEIVIRWN